MKKGKKEKKKRETIEEARIEEVEEYIKASVAVGECCLWLGDLLSTPPRYYIGAASEVRRWRYGTVRYGYGTQIP